MEKEVITILGEKYVLGPDVDLDKEVILDGNGNRITNEMCEEIVEEVHRVLGRPSLTAPKVVSPEIKARVPQELKLELEAEAKRQGKTSSALIREALEDYLHSA